MNYEYGDVSKYHPRKLTEKILGKARTGNYAGNPAIMVLMVREIDRLRERIKDYEDDFQAVMSEDCKTDEIHCTCVPYLKKRIQDLEEIINHANSD